MTHQPDRGSPVIRSDEERNALAIKHAGLVRRVFLAQVRRNTTWGRHESDAMQDGHLGLLHAAARWDPDLGTFEPYAMRCIWGTMNNGTRFRPHADHVSERLRATEVTVPELARMVDQMCAEPIKLTPDRSEQTHLIGVLTRAIQEEAPARFRRRPSFQKIADMVILLGIGLSRMEIAEAFGVSRERVRQWLLLAKRYLEEICVDALSARLQL